MGHIVLVQLIAIICLGWWCAVRYSPGVLALLMPKQITFWIGAGFFLVGCFLAYLSTQDENPAGFVSSLIQCFVGGWLMLVPALAVRGSPEYDHAMKTLGALLAVLVSGMVLLFYIRSIEGTVMASLWLLMLGTLLTLRWRRTCR